MDTDVLPVGYKARFPVQEVCDIVAGILQSEVANLPVLHVRNLRSDSIKEDTRNSEIIR